MNMKTPLGKVRGLGSAKAGTDHFWHQRLTAAAMVPLTIGFVLLLLQLAGQPYAAAKQSVSAPLVAIALLLFVGVGVWHMRLGMQVILEDYVHRESTKLVLLVLNSFFSVGVGAACIFAILKISFGA